MINVKICGITNLEDAVVAAEAGADYLGFILYPPSKRACAPQDAQRIVSQLRSRANCPQLVGVFVNEPRAFVQDTLLRCHFDMAQLHGEESAEYLQAFDRSAYKAIRPRTMAEAESQAAQLQQRAINPHLMIDAYHPDLYGGTGETSDWEMARRVKAYAPNLMLAGGLTVANVAQAVREVQPWCVDVASGVEARPGIKNHTAVREFIYYAKHAN